MRHLFIALCLLLPLLSFAQKDIELKEYSFHELFEMIDAETDSVFRIRDAFIKYSPDTDQDFLSFLSSGTESTKIKTQPPRVISKGLIFENVIFSTDWIIIDSLPTQQPMLKNIEFQKPVEFFNTMGLSIKQCVFNKFFRIRNTGSSDDVSILNMSNMRKQIFLSNNEFKDRVRIQLFGDKRWAPQALTISENKFTSPFIPEIGRRGDEWLFLNELEISIISFENNIFEGKFRTGIAFKKYRSLKINGNQFLESDVDIDMAGAQDVLTSEFRDNKFKNIIALDIDDFNPSFIIDYDQLESGFKYERRGLFIAPRMGEISRSDYRQLYRDSIRIENEVVFKQEVGFLGRFYKHYKEKFDTKSANKVYVDLKNLETERMAFEYQSNPSFDTFFTWKINQFLKLFSAYGTKPSRAIIFSVYVILTFALVYLFFPNYWDSHGKNRIMDRYRFFTKYMKQNSGMHEVYLDEKQPELMASEDFRGYMQQSEKEIPKFFMSTALPLYRWSIAGTKSASWLLSKVDVLKGKWSDTEDSKKGGKSVLLIGAFLVALLYDIFIKMLNALMLSINTFTTLGFGEIPIKGLPRYLAIIQGFIGWFMLTIFSVSLISQLLN